MKIVFMGTPDFAIPSLKMLTEEGYDVAAVVTQPDKPKGRGKKLAFPPVKEFALQKGISVLQPEKVKTVEFVDELKKINPDLLVTAAYGQILPKEVLDIPKYGCINVHASLLPKYRGAAPIQWAIINGEKVTGVTTMFTDIGMDTGDMLLKAETEIDENITYGELHDKLAVLGADVLKKTLEKLKDNTLVRIPQPHEQATYAPMIKKEMGLIDWKKSARSIHNLVRGTNPWPVAFSFYKNAKFKIWKTIYEDSYKPDSKAGTILEAGKDGILVACGEGCLRILEIQFESAKRMSVREYLCGHKIDKGEVLGQ